MLLRNEKTGTFTGGPLDVVCILRDSNTGRFHPAFFEERPLPGPIEDVRDTKIIRLSSRMHHTEGFATVEEGLVGLEDLVSKIELPAENVWREPKEWNGEYPISLMVENWRRK